MLKKVMSVILMILLIVGLIGCASVDSCNNEIEMLEEEIEQLKTERDTLKEEVLDLKVESGEVKYVITFNIKQVHYNLSLEDHLKDAMNDISIQIPVDKEYYDSVEVGQVIDDSFRVGSFVMKGSFGKWKVTVENKEIMQQGYQNE